MLRGGPSDEYNVSLKSGGNVLSLLRELSDIYDPIDIFISKDGEWHREGLVYEPHQALGHVDVVWNALHGSYGEDGQVQRVLEGLKIPFTGSGALSSAFAMNKVLAKDFYKKHGLLSPRHELVEKGDNHDQLIHIFRNYLLPVIIKPTSGGSSIGIMMAETFKELENAIRSSLNTYKQVLVEEFIKGKEATCAVVENFAEEKLYALPPVEIKVKGKSFFDFESKYSGKTKEICPGKFTSAEKAMIEDMSKKAHEILGLRHYSRSDFIITPKGNVYILETNSLPGLTEESLLPKSLKAINWHPRDFVDHVLKLTI